MKAKKIMSLISLLSCIALISVGFASWYIVGNDSKDISGQFVAEAVTDNSVSIVDASFTDGKVHFGAPESSADGANYWLVNSDYEKEDLTATLTFKITNASGLDSVEVKMSENGNEKYNAALEANVIEAVVIEKINEVNNDDNSITYEYKLTFAWGSAFEGKNPYTYFNQYSKSENSSIVKTEAAGDAQAVYYTYKELAELYIGKVYELNGADFTVTISASGKGIETQYTEN